VTGGGSGGNGGLAGVNTPGSAGVAPGGGGGSGCKSFINEPGAAGTAGQVTLTWSGGSQTFVTPGTYTWTAGAGALAYATVARANDDTQLANDIQVTVAGSANLQEATDAGSISAYLFPRSYARTDLPLQSDRAGLYWAAGVLYLAKTTADRFDTLTVDPQADVTTLWQQVLGREMGDRIQIWKTPPGVVQFSKDTFIAGIAHVFDATQYTWATTWTLQDASRYTGFLTLGSNTSGILGTNLLAF
jgi:hypothetical protein